MSNKIHNKGVVNLRGKATGAKQGGLDVTDGIASCFGGTKPDKISEYYRGATGANAVPDSTANAKIAKSGLQKFSNYLGAEEAAGAVCGNAITWGNLLYARPFGTHGIVYYVSNTNTVTFPASMGGAGTYAPKSIRLIVTLDNLRSGGIFDPISSTVAISLIFLRIVPPTVDLHINFGATVFDLAKPTSGSTFTGTLVKGKLVFAGSFTSTSANGLIAGLQSAGSVSTICSWGLTSPSTGGGSGSGSGSGPSYPGDPGDGSDTGFDVYRIDPARSTLDGIYAFGASASGTTFGKITHVGHASAQHSWTLTASYNLGTPVTGLQTNTAFTANLVFSYAPSAHGDMPTKVEIYYGGRWVDITSWVTRTASHTTRPSGGSILSIFYAYFGVPSRGDAQYIHNLVPLAPNPAYNPASSAAGTQDFLYRKTTYWQWTQSSPLAPSTSSTYYIKVTI